MKPSQTLQKYWYARIRPSQALQTYWYAWFWCYFSRAGIVRTAFFSNQNRAYQHFAHEKLWYARFGDSFVWSPFSPPISIAEVAPRSRKQVVLRPLFFSIFCIFDERFLDTCAFLEIAWVHSDWGRGKQIFEHHVFVIWDLFSREKIIWAWFLSSGNPPPL